MLFMNRQACHCTRLWPVDVDGHLYDIECCGSDISDSSDSSASRESSDSGDSSDSSCSSDSSDSSDSIDSEHFFCFLKKKKHKPKSKT